ncbi:NAD-dependent epimerase/dehydratase family protein [Megamonas hypermegale]|uniref:NAD-dependent epimerase/dehydratase family protein n=1 Tax=Megamonas hypermegale TaxID=158847 RepID=UPI00195BFF11|nr:NAD(P)-dependent oxidoreductase [Megamonas hypermegale]
MKKAIVTGANGFVGRYLVRELLDNNCKVWIVVRNKSKICNLFNNNSVKIIECDLSNYKNLDKLFTEHNFDCFYHLAWEGSSGDFRKDYEMQLKNVESSAQAVRAASILNCRRFVGAGSVTELMYRNYLQNDNNKPEMVTCYAIGKMMAEYLCRCICIEYNVEFIWGYLSNFYGIGDKTNNFINYLSNQYLLGRTPILTEGNQLADFTYVSDIATALYLLGEKGVPGKNYYVGYGNPQPLKNFVLKIRDNINVKLESGLNKKSFQGISIDFDKIDINKLSRDTGFVPKIDFDKGIKLTLEWIKNK